MVLFRKIAHERLKALLLPLGFKKRGDLFHRKVGYDVQGLFFQISQTGHDCEFYFGILPEYIAVFGMDGIGEHALGWFGKEYEVWEYYNNEESIHAYLDERIEKIKKYILPYFENPNKPIGSDDVYPMR